VCARQWSSPHSVLDRVRSPIWTAGALGRAVARELTWGLSGASHEIAGWRALAGLIPDVALRSDALEAIDRKRANLDGAVLFTTLARRRSDDLLRLLVAYELLADYLDCTSERGAAVGVHNGHQLHRALIEALDPRLGLSDYYRFHPWNEDGGFVRALVQTCRQTCVRLPSYDVAQPFLLRAAWLAADVLPLNHEEDAHVRDARLRAWACTHFPRARGVAWFELTGGASAWLTVLALLALAADAERDAREVTATYTAYLPWISLAGTLLDSYGDQEADASSGAHRYVAHYATPEAATERIGEVIRRSLSEATALHRGTRHRVIVSAMAAMYLSKDSVHAPAARTHTRALVRSAGPLTRLLIPVLRVWRILNNQTEGLNMQLSIAPRHRQRRQRLPRGAPLPSIAQTLAFWRDPHAYLRWCRTRYGTTFTVRSFGKPPLVFMSQAADIKTIVNTSADVLHPGRGGRVIAPLVGDGSFMIADGTEHLAGRRNILPAFQRQRVSAHEQMVQATAAREIASWPLDAPVTLQARLRALTLRVILQMIFGDGEERLDSLHTRLLAMFSVSASLALHAPPLRHVPPWRDIWRRFTTERHRVDALIAELIAERACSPTHDEGILAMLLASERGTNAGTIDHVRSTLLSLILAGHETTAGELAWTVQLLAHHPDVMRRLVRELDRDGEGNEYLQAVIDEALRHRPVFLFTIPRAVAKPVAIAGRTYRPPVHLVGCVHLMQHDAAHYSEPDRFRPERFLDKPPQPDAWMPWGGGRKRCPGHHLAMLEMRTVLRTLLERVEIEPATPRMETARWRTVIVVPGEGCKVVLRKRWSRASVRVPVGPIHK
jgi:tetraprenyl-beta-curcumene synthase